MIIYKENICCPQAFDALYDAVGWGRYAQGTAEYALQHSLFSVSAWDEDVMISFGRVIGDGICFLHIHDVMVHPEYQGKHIGTEIMKRLLAYADTVREKNPSVRIYLGASEGMEGFYRTLGFETREEAGLGPGMVLMKK